MRIRRRASAALLVVLVASLATPAGVFAAVPVANDDPGIACGGGNFGGAFPIPEDYRVAGPYGEWFTIMGTCSLLGNDTDADGDALTYEFVTAPAHGQVLKINENGFAYQVEPDYSTIAGDQPGGNWVSDSFTYHACDATDCSAPATMRFWIAPVNDPPTFTGGPPFIEVDEDSGPYSAPWASAISPGPPSESAQTVHFEVSVDTHGLRDLFTVEPAISSSGALTFTAGPDQYGLADVTVRAKDDGGLENYRVPGLLVQPDDTSDEVTFEIVVYPVDEPPNHAPVADDETLTVDEDAGPTTVPVLDGDVDPDGDALEILSASDPLHGTVEVSGDGSGLTYEPDPGYHGPDSFTYTVSDGSDTDTATVSVTVVPHPGPPRDTTPPMVTAPNARWVGQTVATGTTTARISWGATDAGSGVMGYKLQSSVDGAGWKTIATSSATTTSVDRNLKTGHEYQFRVRATDGEGNVSSYATGASLTPVRYSEASARMTYLGAWKKTTSPKALGGAARHATASTKRATFHFTGYDVGWIATRTMSSGKARIFIDGIPVGTVDLDRASTVYRKLVFARHFATLAAHDLEIQPVGDGRVDIDGFVVLR